MSCAARRFCPRHVRTVNVELHSVIRFDTVFGMKTVEISKTSITKYIKNLTIHQMNATRLRVFLLGVGACPASHETPFFFFFLTNTAKCSIFFLRANTAIARCVRECMS